jgi:hypothetical protein
MPQVKLQTLLKTATAVKKLFPLPTVQQPKVAPCGNRAFQVL